YNYTAGTLNGGDNYIISSISGGKLTITACPLIIQANDSEKVYGATDPTLSYYFDGEYGLVNGDTLTGSITRAAGSNVGTYTISKGTLAASSNYSLTFRNATFTITKRPICVSAENKTKQYGSSDPAFTSTPIVNSDCYSLLGSDSLSGTLSRESGSGVGYYAITKGTLTAGSNYDLTVTSGELEITPRPITITPDAKSKTYGENDPNFTFTVTTGSLVGSDSLVGSLWRDEGENAGQYSYNIGQIGEYNPNYSITFNNTNKFTINKKRITVTGVDTRKYYGYSDPELEYTSSGLVWGDTLTGSLGRAPGENVGNYNYTAGTLSGGSNYIIDSISGGKLVIAKRDIYVCAYDKYKTYGDSDPTFNYYNCGDDWLVGSDTFTGALSRTAGNNVGTYAIGKGTLALSSNYNLNYYSDNLYINAKTIYLDAANKNKVYGNSDPALTYTLTSGYSWVGSDIPTVTLGRDSGEDIGFYDIYVKNVTSGSNYDIYVNSGSLEITKRPITI
ncbi:MAG: hemagglutination protein, partial [Microbacteriaceae bacterium]|nr:hemagglutination protein [Microbacteriaceae bacterium]